MSPTNESNAPEPDASPTGGANVAERGAASFRTTHWSVVLSAGREPMAAGTDALDELCQSYWYPLYAYVRRHGYDATVAKDLTQEFFAQLLGKQLLAGVDPSKGSFRSWLLGVMNHFLAHEWAKNHAQKRGGGRHVVSLDQLQAEERYALEPMEKFTPEKIFERRWAFAVLDRAAAVLRQEYEAAGKGDLYLTIKQFVSMDGTTLSYDEAARSAGVSPMAVKSAIHRLRQRYQELIRAEIARTVGSVAEVDEELRYLLAAIRGS